MDSKQIRNLMEAYSQVHAPQEIDEKFVDPTGVDYDPKRSGMKSPDKKMLEKHKELRAKGDPESVARAGKIAKAKLQMALRTNEEVAELDERFHRGGGSMRPASETQSSAPSSNSSSKKGRSKAAGMAARMRFMNADKEQVKQAAEGLEIGEAVKGASPHTMQMRKAAAAERKAGIKPLPAKKGEEYAKYKMSQMAYAKRKREMDEELDIFDIVLEFLQTEGYAETLEQAEWMMANVINGEAIDIILGGGQLDEISDKRVIAARNALAKRTDKANARNDGNAYSRNVSREARMNARIQSRNQRTGSNVEPTFTRRHQ